MTATVLPTSYDLKDAVSANRLKGLWRLATGFRLTYLGATVALAIGALAKTATALLLRYFVDDVLGQTQQASILISVTLGFVLLALVETARRVFSTSADTFLSFPVFSPLTMTADALAAVAAPKTAQDFAAAGDFARMVNFIPRDMVATIEGGWTLWEIYADVLSRAVVGTGLTDPAEEEEYRGALQILQRDTADGLRQESEKYRVYRQYRDAWFVAQEDYRAKRLTGETSNDPSIQQQWRDQEPILRAHITAVEGDWRTAGYRDEIEAALAIVQSVSAANPALRWRDWQAAFNPDLDLITEAGGQFAPTGYSPVNLQDSTAWSRFEISSTEITALVAEAPEELRRALHDDPDPIDQVAFDYRSVALTRPWFSEAALTSRIWRMPVGEDPLSDGANTASGQCPAYVVALVLMRGLEVHRPSGDSQGGGLSFDLPLRYLTPRLLPHPDDEIGKWKARTKTLQEFELDPNPVAAQPDLVKAFTPVTAREFRTTVTQPAVDRGLINTDAVRATRIALPPRVWAPRFGNHIEILRRVPIWLDRVVGREPAGAGQPADPPPDDQTPPATSTSDITILAFICKRLPKTPDPLPNMQW